MRWKRGGRICPPEEALRLHHGGVTSPVLDAVLVDQLQRLNPGRMTPARSIFTQVVAHPAQGDVGVVFSPGTFQAAHLWKGTSPCNFLLGHDNHPFHKFVTMLRFG